jgi:hypothetical protein
MSNAYLQITQIPWTSGGEHSSSHHLILVFRLVLRYNMKFGRLASFSLGESAFSSQKFAGAVIRGGTHELSFIIRYFKAFFPINTPTLTKWMCFVVANIFSSQATSRISRLRLTKSTAIRTEDMIPRRLNMRDSTTSVGRSAIHIELRRRKWQCPTVEYGRMTRLRGPEQCLTLGPWKTTLSGELLSVWSQCAPVWATLELFSECPIMQKQLPF